MQLNSYIDHTILKPTTLVQDVELLCNQAIQYQFAAVCVPPPFVKLAKQLLVSSPVRVATVIGFPMGYSAIEAKVSELVLAMVDGADELDVVISITAIKNQDWSYLASELTPIVSIVKKENKVIKIIIESGELTDDEIIKCCQLYGVAEIDYLKTSTGYAKSGATVHAVQLFRKNLPSNVGIKASGGIRDYNFAKDLIQAGATRLGCSASIQIVTDPQNKP